MKVYPSHRSKEHPLQTINLYKLVHNFGNAHTSFHHKIFRNSKAFVHILLTLIPLQ